MSDLQHEMDGRLRALGLPPADPAAGLKLIDPVRAVDDALHELAGQLEDVAVTDEEIGRGPAPPTRARVHADMHPLTKARVDAGAGLGRCLAALTEAHCLLAQDEVTGAYVTRKRGEYDQALQRLVEAAQAEGAG
jgi:hypothetical protein